MCVAIQGHISLIAEDVMCLFKVGVEERKHVRTCSVANGFVLRVISVDCVDALRRRGPNAK